MPLLLADFIHSRRCKPNLRKNVDTTCLSENKRQLSIKSANILRQIAEQHEGEHQQEQP